jgi:2-keto-4-pentenoate hydratase
MTPQQISRISQAFRSARAAAQALPEYPGLEIPPDLDNAYAIQEDAIAAWPDTISGWKVAAIQPAWRDRYASDRLAGPVFSKTVWDARNGAVSVPVIEGGYAAIEAEFAIRLSDAIPASEPVSRPEQLLPYIEGIYAALEIAASPLAALSALGPGAVVSDFGNNSGLVIGAKLPQAILTRPADSSATMDINGVAVGQGDAARVPGGPLSALMFLVNHLASRGRTLPAGLWISTGASTGIHPVRIGDAATARFNDAFSISVNICAAVPRP